MRSASKTVASMLVGLAIRDSVFHGVEQTVLGLLPYRRTSSFPNSIS